MHADLRSRGFNLTEVLIVVAVILFLAAVIVPKLTSSQIAAREASALAALHDIHTDELKYSETHPQEGFTRELSPLHDPANLGGDRPIEADLAQGEKSGYRFTYTPGAPESGLVLRYTVTAVPEQPGVTGKRSFYSDQTGAIHYNVTGAADASSPVIQ